MSLARVALAGLALVLLGALAVYGFVFGGFVRWSDAYVRLESRETLSRGMDQRLRLANAMAEGDPPKGLAMGSRIHPAPVLARLRYEQLDAAGNVMRTDEIRALVPPLPYFGNDAPGSDFGRIECPRKCREELERSRAELLHHSGEAGLAEEWVLRMPVGQTFELGRRSLSLQDFSEQKKTSLPESPMRVTLTHACPAKVRVGEVTSLEFNESAMIPVPKDLRARHWIQLDGCAELMAARPLHPAPPVVVAAAPRVLSPPEPYLPSLEAIRAYRAGHLGHAELIVDENWMQQHGAPLAFRLRRVCRYDPDANRWEPLPFEAGDFEIALRAPASRGIRSAYRFPEQSGFFWAEWTEADLATPAEARVHSLRVPAGPTLYCRDADYPPRKEGEIAACVPRAMLAEARAIPDPETNCAR